MLVTSPCYFGLFPPLFDDCSFGPAQVRGLAACTLPAAGLVGCGPGGRGSGRWSSLAAAVRGCLGISGPRGCGSAVFGVHVGVACSNHSNQRRVRDNWAQLLP